jgi:hypothetical protein
MGAQPTLRVRNSQWPAFLLAALLPACGGSGGSGGGGGTIKGVVADGPIIGATINCFRVDVDTGQPTGPAINTTAIITDGNGSFTLTTSTNITGPLMCDSTGGADTVSMTPAPDLSVLIPDSLTGDATMTANLTPLTTVATQIVQTQIAYNGGAASAQELTDTITNTLMNVATAFGLTDFDLLTRPPNAASSDPQQVKYQQILDNLSAMLTSNPSVTFTALTNALATDLANDDVLDGLDGSPDTPVFIDSTPLDQVPEFQTLLDTVIEMGFDSDNDCIALNTPNSVCMVRNATKSTAGVLAIDVKANAINGNVIGAAFEVDIQNTNVTQWNGLGTMTCTESTPSGCEPGDFLEQPPATVDYVVRLQQGILYTLLVGATQVPFSETPGGDGGTIVTLKFKKCDNSCSGSSRLQFFDTQTTPCDDFNNPIGCNTLLDSSLNDIPVAWYSGTMTVINFPPIPPS